MKNKYLLLVVGVLSIIAIISSPKKKTTFFDNEKKQVELTIKNNEQNKEEKLNLEDYIVGVVAGEMPASFHEEALKAQAVAARTYAIYKMNTTTTSYDLTTDVSNQVYIDIDQMKEKWGSSFDKYYEKIKKAVDLTKNEILKYDDQVISSYYFAISNGKTEDVSLVFGETRDYLKSIDSTWDESVKNFSKTTTMSKNDFCTKLDINCDNIKIAKIKKSASGRVNTIVINGKTFKGTEIRKKLNLRSTDFEIAINSSVEITTKGYGHGVGMSQYGANEMAKNGYSYDQILKYYYQNVDVVKMNV